MEGQSPNKFLHQISRAYFKAHKKGQAKGSLASPNMVVERCKRTVHIGLFS